MRKKIWLVVLIGVIGSGVGMWFFKKGELDADSKPYTTFGINTDNNPNVNPKLKKEEPKKIEKETEEEIIERVKECAQTPNFKMLKKNPDKYKDIDAIYEGYVGHAREQEGANYFIVHPTRDEYGRWDTENLMMVRYEGKREIVEGDIIKVYGHIRGNYEYESVSNWHISCPALMAEAVTVTRKSK
jgi:hypothetical protein